MAVAARLNVAPEVQGATGEPTSHAPPPIRVEVELPHSRGPLRPAALAPVRRRLSPRAVRRSLRLWDAGVLLLLAGGCLAGLRLAGRPTPVELAAPCALSLLLVLAVLPAVGAYAFDADRARPHSLGRALGAPVIGGVPLLIVLGAVQPKLVGQGCVWLALLAGALAASRLVHRALVRRWRAQGRLTPNIVVVGATANAAALIDLALQTREVAVLGVFDDRSARAGADVHGVPVLGDTAALIGHRTLPYVDRVVLTVNAAGPARTAELIERLRVLPNELCLLLDADAQSRSTTLSWLARSSFSLGGARRREEREVAKRLQDLALGALMLVVAAPVMAAVALAVRLDSPGPILFRQRRHGFNNEEILVWKFRSMRTDATDQSGARQVGRNDDRVTRVGRFIRRTSLDELPQVFNVLQGRMSLVGPRPHPVGMKTAGQDSARLVAEYAWRHRMKPGITGWAQINGSRGPVSTAEEVRRRVELDVDYIERQSFWLDLYIVLMTVPRLLGDKEAVR